MKKKLRPDPLLWTNVENERAFLGALLIDPEQAARWLPALHGEYFTEPRHAAMLAGLHDAHARHGVVDMVALDESLRRLGTLAEVGQHTIHDLVNSCTSADLADTYAGILIENWAGRAQYYLANQLAGGMARGEAIHRLEQIGATVERFHDVAEGKNESNGLEDLMGEQLAPVRWVVPGLIPEGVTVLASKRKLGKSWLVFALAIAVGAGGRWLGREVEQGEALYLALEDGKRRLQDRARKLLMGERAPSGVFYETEWPLLSAGGVEKLDRWLRTHPAARVVIVDVLARVKTPAPKGGDPYLHEYSAVLPLKRLADRYHVGIVLTHHARKADATDIFDAVHGSTGLTAAADTLMVLSRARGEREAQLAVTGRDAAEATYALRFAPATGTWEVLGDAGEVARTEEQTAVLRILRGVWPETMGDQQIAERLGYERGQDYSAVRARLSRMVAAGQITSPARGQYRAVDRDTASQASQESGRTSVTSSQIAPGHCDDVTLVRPLLNGRDVTVNGHCPVSGNIHEYANLRLSDGRKVCVLCDQPEEASP